MKLSHKQGFIDRESYVAQYLALAIFTAGVVSTIGSDDLLAAFAAGACQPRSGRMDTHLILDRKCYFLGRRLPRAHGRRRLFFRHRSRIELWLFHLHWRLASFRLFYHA